MRSFLWSRSFLGALASLEPTHVKDNLHELGDNVHRPGDNLHEPRDNLNELVTLSDFHGVCVSGPLHSVRRPWDVIYFLKAMSREMSSQGLYQNLQGEEFTGPKLVLPKAYPASHLLSFASLFLLIQSA